MKKRSIKNLIRKKLQEDGEVSNWWLIDNKITTRASHYIMLLRREGLDIKTEMEGKECIYKLANHQRKKKQVVRIIERDGEQIAQINYE